MLGLLPCCSLFCSNETCSILFSFVPSLFVWFVKVKMSIIPEGFLEMKSVLCTPATRGWSSRFQCGCSPGTWMSNENRLKNLGLSFRQVDDRVRFGYPVEKLNYRWRNSAKQTSTSLRHNNVTRHQQMVLRLSAKRKLFFWVPSSSSHSSVKYGNPRKSRAFSYDLDCYFLFNKNK